MKNRSSALRIKRMLSVIFTLLTAAALIACAACSHGEGPASATPAPTAEPTPAPTLEPIARYEGLEGAFVRLEKYLTSPGAEGLSGILPNDTLGAMQAEFEGELSLLGLTPETAGYESYEALLAGKLTPPVVLAAMGLDGVPDDIEGFSFTVTSAEPVDASAAEEQMEEGALPDTQKISSALRLSADFALTFAGGEEREYKSVTLYAYLYDGEYYLCMRGFERPSAYDIEAEGQEVADTSVFDPAFLRLRALALDPSPESIKGLFPAEYFVNLQAYLENMLAQADMTLPDLGYESFDDFLAGMFDAEVMQHTLVSDSIGEVGEFTWKVNSCRRIGVDEMLGEMGTVMQYLDREKIAAAYRLNADLTAVGENGEVHVEENEDMYVYLYEGEYYLIFY